MVTPKVEPINIQIDPVHLRTQIKTIIDDEFFLFADKLRVAADALDPKHRQLQDQWIEDEVEKRVATRLKEAESER